MNVERNLSIILALQNLGREANKVRTLRGEEKHVLCSFEPWHVNEKESRRECCGKAGNSLGRVKAVLCRRLRKE